MLIKPCTYFYERYPATCKALRLVLVNETRCNIILFIFSEFHCFTPKKYGKTCLQPLQNLITKFCPTTCKALDLLSYGH